MHIDEVVQLALRKLQDVGAEVRTLPIEIAQHGMFAGIEDPLRIEPAEHGPILVVGDIAPYQPDALERIIEHRAAWYAQRMEQGPTVIFGSPHPLIATVHQRIRDSYLEYVGGKRMIAEFGQYSYDEYRDTSAPGLCDAIHEQWRQRPAPEDRLQLITFLLREHAKDLLAAPEGLAPKVIGEMLPALQAVFDYVNGLYVPPASDHRARADAGILRAKLLSLVGAHLCEHVDILGSYEKGRVLMLEGGDLDVLARFHPPLSDEGVIHASAVQKMILQGYGMAAADAPPMKTFYIGTFTRRANGN